MAVEKKEQVAAAPKQKPQQPQPQQPTQQQPPQPPVERALEAAKPKKPGLLSRLFTGLLGEMAPSAEPLEEQERKYALEAMRKRETPQEARERERGGEELRKMAEVKALKERLPAPAVEEALLSRPEKMVELVIPQKPAEAEGEAAARPPGPHRPEKAVELLPARERYASPARLPATPEAARREEKQLKKRAEETEAEEVLNEIRRVAEHEAAVAGEAPVHRRYLVRREEKEAAAAGREGGVRVRAPAGVAEKEEFTQLVQDVYTQLSAKKEEGISERFGVQEPPKPTIPQPSEVAPAPQAEAKPISSSMEELLGIKPAAAKPAAEKGAAAAALPAAAPAAAAPAASGTPLFAQLAEIGGKPSAKPEVALVQVEAKKGMGCPTCHSTNSKIVFCPYCATGLCANCSPKVVPKEDSIIYTCPKCGEEVPVKKKA